MTPSMATCPDCGGYLGDSHHCPQTLRRRGLKGAITAAAAGAAAGAGVSMLTGSHTLAAAAVTSLLGAFVAVSIFKAVPR